MPEATVSPPKSTARSANAPTAFHLLAKPTGAVCNLDCTYCFFLSKEALYPGSRFRMADNLLEIYLRQLLEAHQTPEVTVAWQGGEPTLMGLAFFQRAVELAERLKRPGQQVQHTIQTNGTLLDDDWAAFFKARGFLVGLSIDGPRALHDAYRVNKGGAGTFDQVLRGWEVLRRHDVDTNVLCTVHAANQDHPLTIYHFFRDELGARYLQFIPIVERATPELLPVANAGWSAPRCGATALHPGRQLGDRALGRSGAFRALPERHLRRVGAARRGHTLRAALRLGTGELAGCTGRGVRLQ
jgi:uncharacterized protein